MANTIIKGDDLMLFDADGKSLAFATSHTFTMTGETVDISSKDHGVYTASSVNKISWEITSENLYTIDAYDNLFDKMVAREAIEVYFGQKVDEGDKTVADDDDLEYWSASNTHLKKGKAFITSLVANASNGDNATYSLTLTGSGKIEKATEAPTPSTGE